jgi:flavin reductase (DIM6/NTAB) family NADH-FMN oxidoreductase RutF
LCAAFYAKPLCALTATGILRLTEGLTSNRDSLLTSPYIKETLIDGAIALVIVEGEARSNAATVSFFSEVAHYPAALWVSIEQSSFTHSLLSTTDKFTLAVLSQTQKQIAIDCGTTSGRDKDKVASLNTYKSPSGYLFLHGAIASTGCNVRERIDLEDHTVFVADIIESHLDSRAAHLRQLLMSDLS